MPEPPSISERLFHLRVGIEYTLAAKQLDAVEEVATGADRRVDLEAVLDACQKVVRAMARGRVHGTGALFECDVITQHCDRRAIVEWMLELDPFELLAIEAGDRPIEDAPDDSPHRFGERLGNDHRTAIDVERGVIVLGMKRNGQVRRDGPRRGRPDQYRDVAAAKRRNLSSDIFGAFSA